MFAFDDPAVGLIREPFIGNANLHLDRFAGDTNSCTISFSASKIPDYDVKLELEDFDSSGSNYKDEENNIVWLCPALLKYFATPPDNLYIKNMGK